MSIALSYVNIIVLLWLNLTTSIERSSMFSITVTKHKTETNQYVLFPNTSRQVFYIHRGPDKEGYSDIIPTISLLLLKQTPCCGYSKVPSY